MVSHHHNKTSPKRVRSSSHGENDFVGTPPTTTPRTSKSTPSSKQSTPTSSTPPIKYYDDEVKRMHEELEKQDLLKLSGVGATNPQKRTKRPGGITVKGFLARVAIFYTLIAYFLVCPSDPTRSRQVCRSLDSFSKTLSSYEPLLRPYYQTAHRKLFPYTSQLHPYLTKIEPYYTKSKEVVGPLVERGYEGFEKNVKPKIVEGALWSQRVSEPYMERIRKLITPTIEWYYNSLHNWYLLNAEPHFNKGFSITKIYLNQIKHHLSPIYPYLHKHYYQTLLPTYHSHLLPFLKTSYATSKRTYKDQIQPRVIVLWKQSVVVFRTKVLPTGQRFYSLYINPQVEKIREKIFEYKVMKERVESVKVVEKKEKVIAEELGVDDLDDFIAELRDTTYTNEEELVQPDSKVEEVDPSTAYPSPEDRKLLMAEKRATIESLSTIYEDQIQTLGVTEESLLIERLKEIRLGAIDDIPKRFGKSVGGLDEVGDSMLGKLGKYFSRLSSFDEKSEEEIKEKIEESEFISLKAISKVRKLGGDLLDEVEGYRVELERKELDAVRSAGEEVEKLVGKAQAELSFGWTWLDDVRVKDWDRFHKLEKTEQSFKALYASLQSGSHPTPTLSSIPSDTTKLLTSIKKEINETIESFEKVLEQIKLKGQKELKGEWSLEKVGEVLKKAFVGTEEVEVATPTNFRESVASVYEGAVDGLPTLPSLPTSILSDSYNSVESLLEVAASKIDSVGKAIVTEVPKIVVNVVDLTSSLNEHLQVAAGEGFAQLSEGVFEAASVVSSYAEPHSSFPIVTPTPSTEGIIEKVESLLGDASQGFVRAVGGEPSPTDLRQSVTSFVAKATSLVREHVEL